MAMADIKILIVDDDPLTATALQAGLTAHGYGTLIANNGKDGLALALQEHPNLIVLDWVMEGGDGEWTIGELRKDDWGKKANVLVLTGHDSIEALNAALRNNITHFFTKGNTPLEQLVQTIESFL